MSEASDSVRPASFPEAGDGPRFAAWLGATRPKVQHVAFGSVEGDRRPRLETIPPPGLEAALPVNEVEREPSSAPPFPAERSTRAIASAPDHARAHEEALARLDAQSRAFAEAAADLALARERAIAGAEELVLELAVSVAEAVLDHALEREPSLHAALARRALDALGADADGVRLRASREAYAAIADAFGGPAIPWDRARVPVVLDPTLEGLGCVAETDDAKADGRLPTLLATVRRALVEERRRHGGDDGEDAP